MIRGNRRSVWLLAGLSTAILAAAVPVSVAVRAATTTPPVDEWVAPLSTIDNDDVNVVYRAGSLRLDGNPSGFASERTGRAAGVQLQEPRSLARPANRIRAALAARTPAASRVDVDVRGQRADGWTEWQPLDGPEAVFPELVSAVQVRLTLSAQSLAGGPTVQALRLRADAVEAPGTLATTAPRSYRVYATREGLVGGTTANGHVIVGNDHFVALPSRRGLAPRDTGDYTVRVCAASTGRCEYAPVWDVGPWNTMDDYWNPAATRQMWKDLAQGTPEAQAAYSSGYNGGKDQFGRTVANPAGIDLADGTFWDGLRLTTNSWVTVGYLWTGSGARGKVNAGGSVLNVRSGAGTTYGVVGLAAPRATLLIECQVSGQSVVGPTGASSKMWDRIGPGNYVSHAYLTGITGTLTTC